jgi:branched-chain amino acid transport system substrate-binding protein
MKKLAGALATLTLLAGSCTGTGHDALEVGALYPLSGSQGQGGIDEHRGVLLAAEFANADGVAGQPIEILSIDVPSSDVAPGAVAQLADRGVQTVLGSYGSATSARIAGSAASRGMVFWETGAVGMLPADAGQGELTFRVAPAGGLLGSTAIGFVADRLAPRMGVDVTDLRFAVSFVDDEYGRSVANGALRELRARGLRLVARLGYDYRTVDPDVLARRIGASGADVLFVSAYMTDGIALRQALVDNGVDLLASIGTSSSYCMPEFGDTLGVDAVGLFASDKPAAEPLNADGLMPEAAALLERANTAYRERWGSSMSPAALAGFSAAWALFAHVLPSAADPSTAESVAAAAQAVELPLGGLPNGSGLRFAGPGEAGAGDNLAAASVIWEWVAPGHAEVVWPPAFATHPIDPRDITP